MAVSDKLLELSAPNWLAINVVVDHEGNAGFQIEDDELGGLIVKFGTLHCHPRIYGNNLTIFAEMEMLALNALVIVGLW